MGALAPGRRSNSVSSAAPGARLGLFLMTRKLDGNPSSLNPLSAGWCPRVSSTELSVSPVKRRPASSSCGFEFQGTRPNAVHR